MGLHHEDGRKLARRSLPILLWAKGALEREDLKTRLVELEARSEADLGTALENFEREREWLAYEMHDRVAQTMASVYQQLQLMEKMTLDLPEVRKVAVRGSILCREAIREARSIMNEVWPAGLDEMGLAPLVEEDLRRFETETRCRIQADISCKVRPPRDLERVVYRILQEALANVRRHANATHLRVSLHCKETEVELLVEDNGVGFDLRSALERPQVGGLLSMQRRAELAEGTLQITGRPGQGTQISAWIPWPRRRQEDRPASGPRVGGGQGGNAMNSPTTVLLVDDHLVVREGLRAILAGEPDIAVVGEASSGEEAMRLAQELAPNVVLMDIRMPGMSGIEATQEIKKAHPTTSVIVLTIYENDMYVVDAIRAGAAGYITKDASQELLRHAIRSVAEGSSLVRSGLLQHAIRGLLRTPGGRETNLNESLVEHLTPREQEVLRLLAQGVGNRAIAQELHLAEVTVKKHVQNIVGKLGVSDRTHAAIFAVRHGLGE